MAALLSHLFLDPGLACRLQEFRWPDTLVQLGDSRTGKCRPLLIAVCTGNA